VYLLYSLLTLLIFVIVSPYFVYQAVRYKKYIGSLRERLGYLPISFNIDGEESIWIHAVSVGEALTARALAADLKARYPRLRLFLDNHDSRPQVARASLGPSLTPCSFPFDWAFIVRRTLHLGEAPPAHHDDRDLAQPPPRAASGRKTIAITSHLVAFIRPLPDDPAVLPRVLADVDRFRMQSEEWRGVCDLALPKGSP
jgi:hypothetical protein